MASVEWHGKKTFGVIARAVDVPPEHILAAVTTEVGLTVLHTTPDEPDFVYARILYLTGNHWTPSPRRAYVGTVGDVLQLGALDEHMRRMFGEPSS